MYDRNQWMCLLMQRILFVPMSENGQDILELEMGGEFGYFRVSSRRGTRIRAVQYHFIVAVNANRGTYLPI